MELGNASKPAVQLLALLVVVSSCISHCFAGGPIPLDARRQLVQKIDETPDADPLGLVSKDVRRMWSRDQGLSINETIKRLVSIRVQPTVEVKLIGFDGTGPKQVRIRDGDMMRYLHTLRAEMDTAVLQPALSLLFVHPDINWRVTHDDNRMSDRLAQAVRSEVDKARSGDWDGIGAAVVHLTLASSAVGHTAVDDNPLLISYEAVDQVISRDRREEDVLLTVYLLNLNVVVGKYAYSYTAGDYSTHAVGTAGAPTPRYVWIDLTATQVSFGPGPRSKGHVFSHAIPHPSLYRDQHLAAALAPQMAALVWSATQHLAWPPVQHLEDVEYKPHLVLQVIHIHDELMHMNERFSRDVLEAALKPLLVQHQSLEVHEVWLPMSGCPLCVDAFTSSLRLSTTRDAMSSVMMSFKNKVLDPDTMHRLMQRYADGIFGHAGVHDGSDHKTRVLPVFLWDIASAKETLLFQGGLQAVAFPDMVMAVASHEGLYHTPAQCGINFVVADSRDPTRAVLAGILQSVWGIANASTFYTPATGPGSNHLWSLSHTPWGYVSADTQLSGPMTEILPRNLVLAHLNSTTTELVALLAGFSRLSRNGNFDASACSEFKDRIMARVNVAMFKSQMVANHMSAARSWEALKYARSLEYDVAVLRRLAFKVAKRTGTALHCEAGPTLASVWWAPCIAVGMWPIAWFLRGRLYRPKLEKMY